MRIITVQIYNNFLNLYKKFLFFCMRFIHCPIRFGRGSVEMTTDIRKFCNFATKL